MSPNELIAQIYILSVAFQAFTQRPPMIIQDHGQKPKHRLLTKYILGSQFLTIIA